MKKWTGLSMLLLPLFLLLSLFTAAAQAYDVSGTVSYAGSKTGRVYLKMETNNGTFGTSISPAGDFTIRGVPPGGYAVHAFMDARDTGSRHADDPAGASASFIVSNASVTGVALTLTDPGPIDPVPAPQELTVLPSDGGALVMWDYNDEGNGEQAESYHLYWSTSSNVMATYATQGGSKDITAAGDSNKAVILTGLTNGTQLFFNLVAKAGSLESSGAFAGPVTIGTAGGGTTISGSVSFPSVPANVPLNVLVIDSTDAAPTKFFTKSFPAPVVSPVSYTVSGVPNGSFEVVAILDMNNNGVIDAGDIMPGDGDMRIVTVTGTSLSNIDLTLSGAAASAGVYTNHWKNNGSEGYTLNFGINAGLKRPAAVTFVGGPNVSGPIDIGMQDAGEFWAWMNSAGTPLVGESYPFDITYADGTSETITAAVTGVPNYFATPTAPTGSVTFDANPTFSWQPPATPPTGPYSYRLYLEQSGQRWESDSIPSDQTSKPFNFDGQAEFSLQSGTSYNWSIMIEDELRNYTMNQTSFSFGTGGTGGTGGTAPSLSVTTESLPYGTVNTPYNQTITAVGGVGPYTFSYSAGTLPPGISFNATTGQLTGTPTTAGTYTVDFQVSDGTSVSPTQPITITISATLPVTMNYGSVYYATKDDGTLWQFLELGTSSTATTLGAMTATVAGPDGFSYSFTDADITQFLDGKLSFFTEFPATSPLAEGVYTFTLNDGQGLISTRVDTHGNAQPIPIPDSSTIQFQRKADYSYRISWAPVNETKTYYYRVRILKADGSGVPVFIGPRSMAGFQDVNPNVLTDGVAYQVRVEASDADYDLMFNRSASSYVNFTPQAADYDANKLLFSYAQAYNRYEADGSQTYTFGFGFGNTADAAKVTSALVTGPNGFSETLNLVQPNAIDFAKTAAFTTAPQPGLYTFNVTANGIDHVAYAILTAAVAYPAADPATYQAEDLGNGNIRFSWADVDHSGALYYRVMVSDTVTGQYFTTARANQTFADFSKTALGDLSTKKWRVEVYDSSAANTVRNRVNGPYTTAPFALQAYDAGRPVFKDFGITRDTRPNGNVVTHVWAVAADSDGSIVEIRVDGPNGYTRNLFTQGKFEAGSYRLFESGTPQTGLYKFTVVDNAGKSSFRYNYLSATSPLAVVDYKSVSISTEPSGDARLSWAPVAGDVPLWYSLQLFTDTDNDQDGKPDQLIIPSSQIGQLVTKTSLVIPISSLPANSQVMFRISAFDGSHSTTFNNRSQSVRVGYAGAGFDYATLTDADGDGYASNVDGDDNDASVFPFAASVAPAPPGIISGTINYAGTKQGRVYITVQTYSGIRGTSITAPGPYTIRGVPPGNYMVRAFMDDKNLGTQVQTSPDGFATASLISTGISGLNITLNDPQATAPAAPLSVSVFPSDGSVLIDWDESRFEGVEEADSYDIYWGTSAAVSKSNNSGSRLNVPAGLDSPAIVEGLTNGSSLYFVVVPKSGGVEGSASAAIGPIVIGAPTGGNIVSGTVNYSGPAPTGPLYVAVVTPESNGAMDVYLTKVASSGTSSTYNFSVSGVPNGTYEVYSLFEMNNDGLFGPGDITSTDEQAPVITVNGAAVSGLSINLTAKNADAIITTDHGQDVTGLSEWYGVEGGIRGQAKRPVAVTLTGVSSTSAQLIIPMDLGINDEGEFRFWGGSDVRPSVGDSYTFSVTYDDGSVDSSLTTSVTGVIDAFPTNVQISTPVSTVPTFSWAAPTTPPAAYKYSLWVWGSNGNVWDAWDLPAGMLSAVYGFNGEAQSLQLNGQYTWNVSIRDQSGNRASIHSSFVPTELHVDTTAPTIVSGSPADGAVDVPVNAVLKANFSEPINQNTLPDETTVLKTGTTFVPGIGFYDAASNTATFTPTSNLAYGTTYSVTISGVKDLAGNTMAGTSTFTFTTEAAPVTDFTPPVTTSSNAGGTYGVAQTVTLTVNEAATIYYTTDGTAPTTASSVYAGPVTISSTSTLKFFAKDAAGNSETVKTAEFVIDTTVPVTTVSPAAGVYGAAQTVSLTASESATIYYTTDGTTPTTSSPVYSASITIAETSTLRFFAKDAAGNSEPVQTAEFVIDTLVPITTVSPAAGLYNASQSVTLTANKSATIYYTTNGTVPTTASSVYAGPVTIASTSTLKFFAKDAAGNSETVKTAEFVIDTTVPVTSVSPAAGLYGVAQTVSLTASESATIYYTTDGTTPTTSSPVYSASITIAETTTLKFFAKDAAGNSETVKTAAFVIDTSVPVTTVSPAGGLYNSSQSVTLTANKAATIYYTTNGTVPTTASSVYAGPITISSTSTLKFFARDQAGNNESVRTETYTIDKTAPTILSSTPANNATKVSVDTALSVKFSEPVKLTSLLGNIVVLSGSTSLTGSADYDSATNTATFTPAAPLPMGTTFTVSILGGIEDLAGNKLAPTTLSFTTELPTGDIDGNGTVDILDAKKMLEIAVGRLQANSTDLRRADVAPLVNGKPAPNGAIDGGDVVVMLQRVVGSVNW